MNRSTICARCLREPVAWTLSGWRICDRLACVRSASYGLLRGLLPDNVQELDETALAAVAKFDAHQHRTKPGPPPWAKR